ncbi:MAG: hypothetical protein ACSHW0_08135 [Thalassotalea sp.]
MYKKLKQLKYALCVFSVIGVLGCSSNSDYNNGEPQWDFDHNLQFSETLISENNYHIEIVPNDRTNFSKLATFLMRRSLRLCQSYGFKIEVLKGVESYDHNRSFPNMIMAKLAANVECPTVDSSAK